MYDCLLEVDTHTTELIRARMCEFGINCGSNRRGVSKGTCETS